MRLLAWIFSKKNRQGMYSLTQESAAFLVSSKLGTHAGFFGTIAPQIISRWLRLSDIVREGRPAVAREPGNGRHGILQSAGGKHHPDELSACAKARRSFEVSEGKKRNSRARSWRRFRYLGHCPRPKITAGAGDRGRLGRNDSDDKANHTKVRRRRSL